MFDDILNAAIKVEDTLAMYSVHVSGRHIDILIGNCPFCSNTTPGTFVINTIHKRWACLGICGRVGSVIDFVALQEHVSSKEARELLLDWYGIQRLV